MILVERLLSFYEPGTPIFTEEILDIMEDYSRSWTYEMLDYCVVNGLMKKYTKGVYYVPKETTDGYEILDINDVLNKKYIRNKFIFGVYGPLYMRYNFGISTQVPMAVEIITNKETNIKREVKINKTKVILKKPRCTIDDENVYSYELLELMNSLKDDEIKLSEYSLKCLRLYIKEKNINMKKVIELSSFFPAKALKNLMVSGVFNELIQ